LTNSNKQGRILGDDRDTVFLLPKIKIKAHSRFGKLNCFPVVNRIAPFLLEGNMRDKEGKFIKGSPKPKNAYKWIKGQQVTLGNKLTTKHKRKIGSALKGKTYKRKQYPLTKVCINCKVEKPLSLFKWKTGFYIISVGERRNYSFPTGKCKQCWNKHITDYYNTYQHQFTVYQKSAKRKNRIFNLTKKLFKTLLSQPCYYCGSQPLKGGRNGIDRLDNNTGYIKGNCVSCCKKCNFMKSNTGAKEFITHCKKITEVHYG